MVLLRTCPDPGPAWSVLAFKDGVEPLKNVFALTGHGSFAENSGWTIRLTHAPLSQIWLVLIWDWHFGSVFGHADLVTTAWSHELGLEKKA